MKSNSREKSRPKASVRNLSLEEEEMNESLDDREVRRAKQNLIVMMAYRGYTIPDIELDMLEAGPSRFKELVTSRGKSIREVISRTYFHESTGRKALVYFILDSTKEVGVNSIGPISSLTSEDSLIDTWIIITKKSLSSSANSHLKDLPSYSIESWRLSELAINPLEHSFSSKIEIVPRDHLEKISDPSNPINPSQLPLSLVQKLHTGSSARIIGDIAVKFIGAQDGDIIRIVRKNSVEDMPVSVSIVYKLVKEI